LTTSDSATPGRRQSQGLVKAVIVAVVVGAVVFGGYVGYLAWTSDSFPVQQKPFAEYASISSAKFNGTEFAFDITWLRADSLPLYAQLTSAATDAANTPVCDTGLATVQAGQEVFMPFSISKNAQSLSNVELSIAVRSLVNGTEFTIVYTTANITAEPGNISPSGFSCQQPAGFE
jgi:hypothetical protein